MSPIRSSHPDGIEAPRSARVALPEVRELDPATFPVRERGRDDLAVDLGPARRQLEADGPPRPARDRGAEERAAHAREGIEDELAALGEELDEPGHQPRRLVGAVLLPERVPEL